MIKQYAYVRRFQCLGAECEDTCCKGWGMQVDEATVAKYRKEAPELLDAVTSGEAERIMRRDPETDYCVKFEGGLCAIHRDKGDSFLGDACHFYPRITRAFGDESHMAAALSCPEIVRLALVENDAFELQEAQIDRLPYSLKNYLPEGLSAQQAQEMTAQLISFAGDKTRTPERSMASLALVLFTLDNRPEKDWGMAVSMYLKMAETMLPAPESRRPLDSYYLLQTLRGLIFAARKAPRERLEAVFARMEQALGITIDREQLDILQTIGREQAHAALEAKWRLGADAQAAKVLRRWIQAQIAMASLPFAGFGRTMKVKAMILCVRFATIRLALMAHMDENGALPNEAEQVRVIQSLARFMDHLSDPELSTNLYRDAGWTTEARLRALVGDG